MSRNGPKTIMVVDDHPLTRIGLTKILEDSGFYRVVGQASDGDEATKLALKLRPDLIVMDIIMPGKNGVDACREIMDLLPETRVLVLTASDEETAIIDAVASGASGYLSKHSEPDEFLTAVIDVSEGRLRIPDDAVRNVFGMLRGQTHLHDAQPKDELTDLERLTVKLFASGKRYWQIAEERGISVVTVRNTLYRVQEKLGVATKPELVIWAVRNGLMDDVTVGNQVEPTL